MSAEMPFGTCERCGKKDTPLRIRYRHFWDVRCECHSPNHFYRMEVCKQCDTLEDDELFGPHTTVTVIQNVDGISKEVKHTVFARQLMNDPELRAHLGLE